MQRLDRNIFDALHNTQDGRKVIALFIVLKSIYRAGGISNYSANRLRKTLGMHLDTLKRLMRILFDNGLCELIGKNKKTLRMRSIRTQWKYKDIDISFIKFSLKRRENGSYEGVRYVIDKIAKELVAVYIMETNRRREYARRLVSSSVNPHSKDEMVKADKERRKRGYGKRFVNKGISYSGLGEKLGMSEQMAFYTVKYLVDNGFLVKQKNIERIDTADKEHLKDMAKIIRDKFGKNCSYTFVCGRFVYFVKANDYAKGANSAHVRGHCYRTSINYKN